MIVSNVGKKVKKSTSKPGGAGLVGPLSVPELIIIVGC
jgi:hypothetical protein